MIRRALLLGAAGLAGCSVLPDRPYQDARRYALAPDAPRPRPAPADAPVLLLRSLRAAPGLEQRGLRSLDRAGRIEVAYWDEWAGPPADLAEEALRRRLVASGLFRAVTAPGSRLAPDLVLEGELTRLQAEPGASQARAALSLLLLADGSGEPRVRATVLAEGSAPLPPRRAGPETAAALVAAFGAVLDQAETQLRAAVARRR